ncbi:MAG: alpha-galactosidase [Planctomycetia bacterium]|nr:alpha-galactosidase [Planctomycetia bacterium]
MRLFFASLALLLASCFAAPLAAFDLPDKPLPSFSYDGHSVDASCFTAAPGAESTDDYDAEATSYTAPDGKFQVQILTKKYKQFPAVEYSVVLNNLSGTESTGIVDRFLSLDWSFAKADAQSPATLNALVGSLCCPDDFTPVSFVLTPGQTHRFDEVSGRSSNANMPFIECALGENSGFLLALGWTGCWAADFENQGATMKIRAGMNRSHFKLLPGESVRQPSILLFKRDDQTRRCFRTMIHRFMVDFKSPRDADGKVLPPILPITAGGGNKTPEMMLDILQYAKSNEFAFDTYWIDAGWYGAPHEADPYPNCGAEWGIYVGDWRVNTTTHPTGNLLPIANAVHDAGMKFLLWFEPERIENGAPILNDHPEFRNANLFDYGNPAALAWMQKTIYDIIDVHKIDIYRQDFNMDPGPIWTSVEDEDRIGMAEARHVTGLYKFLDDMRAKFPGILQENCASGGRRLDFEMISRAHSYCRSDYYIGQKPDDTAFHLGQNNTLNTLAFLPFQGGETNCVPMFDDYGFMSVVSSSSVFTPTDFDGGIVRRPFSAEETAWFVKMFGLADRVRPYYLGDFHPLTDETTAADNLWCAWQLHREDLNSGFVIVFRRKGAPESTRNFTPGAIDANATYKLEFFNGEQTTVPGSELARLSVTLEPRAFQFFFYTKL